MKRTYATSCTAWLIGVGFLLVDGPSAHAQTPQAPPTSERPSPQTPPSSPQGTASALGEHAARGADSAFALQAAIGGLKEVSAGRLASERATNDEVKKFAQEMVTDHEKANGELKQIAESKGLSLPADAEAKNKAALSKLEKLKGAAFDKAYMDDQVKDHEKTVNLFEREANSGKDPELKAFAGKALPTLREHLKKSRDIRSKLTNKGTS